MAWVLPTNFGSDGQSEVAVLATHFLFAGCPERQLNDSNG